jgi:hypothetical protein
LQTRPTQMAVEMEAATQKTPIQKRSSAISCLVRETNSFTMAFWGTASQTNPVVLVSY